MDNITKFSSVYGRKMDVFKLLEERGKNFTVNLTGEQRTKTSFADIALKHENGKGFIIRLFDEDNHFEIYQIDEDSVSQAVKFMIQENE